MGIRWFEQKNGSLNSVEYYDNVTNKGILSTSMIERRAGHDVVAFRHNNFIIRGHDKEVGGFVIPRALCTAEVLHTTTKQFTSIKPMHIPRAKSVAAISKHKLYSFGGFNNNNSVEFDLYTGE